MYHRKMLGPKNLELARCNPLTKMLLCVRLLFSSLAISQKKKISIAYMNFSPCMEKAPQKIKIKNSLGSVARPKKYQRVVNNNIDNISHSIFTTLVLNSMHQV